MVLLVQPAKQGEMYSVVFFQHTGWKICLEHWHPTRSLSCCWELGVLPERREEKLVKKLRKRTGGIKKKKKSLLLVEQLSCSCLGWDTASSILAFCQPLIPAGTFGSVQ